mmetsp:Transcript_41315/g.113917  ORF Transcript_41315/g.113917 Transcript_41315/m.113917 type:complete len:351 (+) Transcript_41315:766-1818(+)
MHVLKRRIVVVPDRKRVRGLDQERIADALVPEIVPDSTHDQSKALCEAEKIVGAASLEEVARREAGVCRVREVVVRVWIVAFGHSVEEVIALRRPSGSDLRVPEGWSVVHRHRAQAHDVANLVRRVQQVEVPSLEVVHVKLVCLKRILKVVQHHLDVGQRQLPVHVVVLLQGARWVCAADEVLKHRPVVRTKLLLVFDRRLRRGDHAEHFQLLEDHIEQLRVVAETVPVERLRVRGFIILLIVGLFLGFFDHASHRLENRRGNFLDVRQEELHGHEHEGRHGVRHDQRRAHHRDDDHDDQGAIAHRVDPVNVFEVVQHVRVIAVLRNDLHYGRLPARSPPNIEIVDRSVL